MKKICLSIILGGLMLQGCNYLDIIPDNMPTLDHSFANEVTTRNYLFTCYAGLPSEASISSNPVFLSGDEYWSWEALIGYGEEPGIYNPWMIARGDQNASKPYLNEYEGDLWETIRKCNTFIERVGGVMGLSEFDINNWMAEAKVIKAYCHFYLMRMYGPIPVIKDNLAIDADTEMVRFKRNTWDECVDYVVQLLDEATPYLPEKVSNRTTELGRMTQAISLSLKAKVLVTSASPQFNGNPYYVSFKNKEGQPLFGAKDDNKWQIAADACKVAIDLCNKTGVKLYKHTGLTPMTPSVKSEYTIRGSVTDKEWNDELIWGSVINPGGIQKYAQAYIDPDKLQVGGHVHLVLGVNMKVARQFYTDKGIPMEEDADWQNKNEEALRTPTGSETDVIRDQTAEFNFNREPRFYASLGFDKGVWYGSGKPDNAAFVVKGIYGEISNNANERTCVTGYWAKKLINMESTFTDKTSYASRAYPWPIIRLADLYLMYAEALNESNATPTGEVFDYVDEVRERAGLKGIKESWAKSTNPSKYTTQEGMRTIIQRERLIELSLEGHRFWDLRRWLLATDYFAQPVTGWNRTAKVREEYYQQITLAMQKFTARDYLWPISVSLLNKNPNLVQTIGWE